MRVPSTVGQTRRQIARLEISVPTSDGEVRIESWDHQNLDELRDHLAEGQGAIYPHMLAKVYEGEVLVAVRFPQWVSETDEKLKSPRQIAWEKLSDEERRAAGRRMARAFVGLFEYDPARLKITFAGKELTPLVMETAHRCPKCEGPIDVGDECVYVKGIGYCPMCAGTFGPDV